MVFFDTNVLVYLFDAGSPAKQRIARERLTTHTAAGETLISTQVLQEFYVVATRKLSVPLEPAEAMQEVRDLAALPLVAIDADLVLVAIETSQRARLSFWDALIVESARRGGATVVLSEDLQAGASYGGLRIVNPFARR